MKRILHLVPSNFWGGGQQYIYELAKGMKTMYGMSFFFVGRSVQKFKDRYGEIGHYKPMKVRSLLSWNALYKLRRHIIQNNIQIIHTHKFKDTMLVALAIIGLKHVKLFLTVHLVEKGHFNWKSQWVYRRINSLIFVSDRVREEYFKDHPDLSNKLSWEVIYNCTSVDKQSNEWIDLRSNYHIDDKTFVLGFLGRVVKGKGIEVLIDSLSQLPKNIVLVIAGENKGIFAEEIQSKIVELNLQDRVFNIGFITNIASFCKQIDCGVLVSTTPEACPLSVLEFQISGKPVITTNNGGQVAMVKDGVNGFLVNPGDVLALKKSILQLSDNNLLVERMGKAALETSKHFTYENFMRQILKVYNG